MKNNIITKLSIALFAILWGGQTQAQTLVNQINVDNLPIIFMGKEVNIHIIAPEPIQFVDLSTNYLIGDLPSENIARIKVEQSGDEFRNGHRYYHSSRAIVFSAIPRHLPRARAQLVSL